MTFFPGANITLLAFCASLNGECSQTPLNEFQIPLSAYNRPAIRTIDQRLPAEDGATEREYPLRAAILDTHGTGGAIGGTGAAAYASLLSTAEIALVRMFKGEIAQRQGINSHFLFTDLDTLTAAPADITAQATSGFLPGLVFRVAEFNLLEGGATAINVEQRHLRSLQRHLGMGRNIYIGNALMAYRNRR